MSLRTTFSKKRKSDQDFFTAAPVLGPNMTGNTEHDFLHDDLDIYEHHANEHGCRQSGGHILPGIDEVSPVVPMALDTCLESAVGNSSLPAGGSALQCGTSQQLLDNRTCPICLKRCLRPAHMRIHMRTHTNEKPYMCPHCGYRAAQKSNLKTHILARHWSVNKQHRPESTQ